MKSSSPIVNFALILFVIWGVTFASFSQNSTVKELIRGVRETKDVDLKIQRMIHLGEYFSNQNFKKTKEIQDKINTFSSQTKNKSEINVALYNALVFSLEQNFKKCAESLQSFEGKDLSDLPKKLQQKIFQYKGYLSIVNYQSKKADSLLQIALSLAIHEKNKSEICRTFCYLSFNETQKKNKEKAFYYIDKAFGATKNTRLKNDVSLSYYYLSEIYRFFGQPDLALSKELIGYTFAKRANNYSLLCLFSKKIGDKQVLIQNLNEALYYFGKSYSYAKVYSDYRLQGIALNSIANVKRLQKKNSESNAFGKRAVIAFRKAKNDEGLGLSELNIARIQLENHSYTLALKHLDWALYHLKNGMNQDLIADAYQLKGEIYKKTKAYSTALFYLHSFMEIQQKIGNSNKVYEIYPTIAEIYESQGNTKKTIFYLKEYVSFSKNNTKTFATQKIAELNEIFRSKQRDELIAKQNEILEKQNRERELSKTKLENISLRNSLQTYIIIAFVIILILTIIIGIYRNKQSAIQQKRREAEMSQILLRTQMNPHFIFNAMSVIQSYIFENDMKNSSKFLVNFSRLIRLILENSPKAFINLETEVEILNKYLETQKIRFEDRFDFEIICPDELIFDNVQIPPMITQPFVENSIEHGQLHTIPNGKIVIQFTKEANMLKIRIDDNGIGRLKSEELKNSKMHKSMALDITKNRIKMINEKYNSEGYLLMNDLDEKQQIGTRVLISLPYINKETLNV